jgi:hypothetical protein
VDILFNTNGRYSALTVALINKIGIFRFIQVVCLFVPVAKAQDAAGRLLLWTLGAHPFNPSLLAAVRTEVARLSVSGFRAVDFEDSTDLSATTHDLLVTVQFTGGCDPNNGSVGDKPASLGYVVASGGAIAPHIFVSCRGILHAIRPFIAAQPRALQNQLMARAIVRVIQHELRHILEQTSAHLRTGLFKAYLQPKELVRQ